MTAAVLVPRARFNLCRKNQVQPARHPSKNRSPDYLTLRQNAVNEE
jgi:hypothetical protein